MHLCLIDTIWMRFTDTTNLQKQQTEDDKSFNRKITDFKYHLIISSIKLLNTITQLDNTKWLNVTDNPIFSEHMLAHSSNQIQQGLLLHMGFHQKHAIVKRHLNLLFFSTKIPTSNCWEKWQPAVSFTCLCLELLDLKGFEIIPSVWMEK